MSKQQEIPAKPDDWPPDRDTATWWVALGVLGAAAMAVESAWRRMRDRRES